MLTILFTEKKIYTPTEQNYDRSHSGPYKINHKMDHMTKMSEYLLKQLQKIK